MYLDVLMLMKQVMWFTETTSMCCCACLCEGLPVQVRDQALKIHDEIPKSDVGKEYYQQNLEREVT